MTQPDLPIEDLDEFVAAIPAIVGMIPENRSAIFIVLTTEGTIKVALFAPLESEAIHQVCNHLKETYPPDSPLIIAIVIDDLSVAREMLMEFGPVFPLPLASLLLIAEYAVGAPYIDVINHMQGNVPDWTTSHMAAEVIADGRVINRTMGDIAQMYVPTEPAITITPPKQADLWPWLSKLAEAVTFSQEYDPAKVGGLLTHSDKARESVYQTAYIDAPNAHAIFAEASRRLRGMARVEALTAAGFSAYVDGEGIMARMAFNQAFDTAELCEPAHEATMAKVLDDALTSGVPPSIIAHSVFKELYEETPDDQ